MYFHLYSQFRLQAYISNAQRPNLNFERINDTLLQGAEVFLVFRSSPNADRALVATIFWPFCARMLVFLRVTVSEAAW